MRTHSIYSNQYVVLYGVANLLFLITLQSRCYYFHFANGEITDQSDLSFLLRSQKQNFNPETIATASCGKTKILKSNVKRKSFKNKSINEERSFHVEVDFKCNTIFENQLIATDYDK